MLATERKQSLLRRIEAEGFVKLSDLQTDYNVSLMTLRRDLRELEHRGLVRRVRGGATIPTAKDIGYGSRERINRLEKEAIGKHAASLVNSGQSVYIDSGTTCMEVARHLLKRQLSNLSLITPSVKVSAELAGRPGIKIIQLGGEIYGTSFGVVGDSVTSVLAQTRVDWAFVGTCGFDVEAGVTNNNAIEVPVKKAAVAGARRCVFLADSSKIGRATLVQIAPITPAHTLITTRLHASDHKALEKLGWQVEEVTV